MVTAMQQADGGNFQPRHSAIAELQERMACST